jgi:hypothetical protein
MNVKIIFRAATEIKSEVIKEAIAKVLFIKIWEKCRCQLVIKFIRIVKAINDGKIRN